MIAAQADQNCSLVANSGLSASCLLFKAIMGALGQIAISITAVLIAGERPSPRGDFNSRSAASGMATQVASNTRMSKAGLRFRSPNCRLGRLRPSDTMMKKRTSEIRSDIGIGKMFWPRGNGYWLRSIRKAAIGMPRLRSPEQLLLWQSKGKARLGRGRGRCVAE